MALTGVVVWDWPLLDNSLRLCMAPLLSQAPASKVRGLLSPSPCPLVLLSLFPRQESQTAAPERNPHYNLASAARLKPPSTAGLKRYSRAGRCVPSIFFAPVSSRMPVARTFLRKLRLSSGLCR